jgi:hypothetical protein
MIRIFKRSGIKHSHEFIHDVANDENAFKASRVQQQKLDRFSMGVKRSKISEIIAVQYGQ